MIVFTDGLDNYSNCMKDDVIEVAKRCHVAYHWYWKYKCHGNRRYRCSDRGDILQ